MEEIKIDKEFIAEVNAQFEKWSLFLNNGIGILAFTLALACLGTASPSINAIFSLIFLMLIRRQGGKLFPAIVADLRSKAKESEVAFIVLRGIEAKMLNFKVLLTQYSIFFVGFMFLAFVAATPLFPKVDLIGFYLANT